MFMLASSNNRIQSVSNIQYYRLAMWCTHTVHQLVGKNHTFIPFVISSIWDRGKSRNFSTKSPSMKPANAFVLWSVANERNLKTKPHHESQGKKPWEGLWASGPMKCQATTTGYISCSMFPTLLMLLAIVCCNLDNSSNISMLNWQMRPSEVSEEKRVKANSVVHYQNSPIAPWTVPYKIGVDWRREGEEPGWSITSEPTRNQQQMLTNCTCAVVH